MASAAVYSEVNSFLSKFMQLSSYGFNGNVNFKSSNGRLHASIEVDLGNLQTIPRDIFTSSSHRVKPSRVRRRKPREKARSTVSSQSVAVQVLVNEHVCQENDVSNLIDEMPASSSQPPASSTLSSSTLTMDDNSALTPDQSSFQPLFLCTACSKAFTSRSLLEEHKTEHDFVPECFPLICDHCNQTFEPLAFMDHMDTPCYRNCVT